jgi:hypothetical protein
MTRQPIPSQRLPMADPMSLEAEMIMAAFSRFKVFVFPSGPMDID